MATFESPTETTQGVFDFKFKNVMDILKAYPAFFEENLKNADVDRSLPGYIFSSNNNTSYPNMQEEWISWPLDWVVAHPTVAHPEGVVPSSYGPKREEGFYHRPDYDGHTNAVPLYSYLDELSYGQDIPLRRQLFPKIAPIRVYGQDVYSYLFCNMRENEDFKYVFETILSIQTNAMLAVLTTIMAFDSTFKESFYNSKDSDPCALNIKLLESFMGLSTRYLKEVLEYVSKNPAGKQLNEIDLVLPELL